MVAKLGHRPFGQSGQWLAKLYTRQFGKAALEILKPDPDLDDVQVANALLDWFEPEPLIIRDPTSTQLSWATQPVRYPDHGVLRSTSMKRMCHMLARPNSGDYQDGSHAAFERAWC